MLFKSPLRGTIRPDARFIPEHPLAVHRPHGSRIPLVTQSFGPSELSVEPSLNWLGGEFDILGRSIKPKKYEDFHRGIDISKGACVGVVLAAAPGVVRTSRRNNVGTEIIVIDHGKVGDHRYRTVYGHLSTRLVRRGDSVVAGAVIGKLGGSGALSTGCHLHFGVKKDGRIVDPWRRLLQNSSIDPDDATPGDPDPPPLEVPDMPIPASDAEYVAGNVALVGHLQGANIRTAPRKNAIEIRTVAGGSQEKWLPTCWVIGESTNGSDRWLARWHDGRWEFTHRINVVSITPL